MRRGSVALLVAILFGSATSCSSNSAPKATARCQAAWHAEEQASRQDVSPALDAALGRLQDATLKVCGSAADFSAAWQHEFDLAFNGETRDQSAHDVLAAFCVDPVDASLTSSAACSNLHQVDPDAFNRTHVTKSPTP
jgi:hypothetical protein